MGPLKVRTKVWKNACKIVVTEEGNPRPGGKHRKRATPRASRPQNIKKKVGENLHCPLVRGGKAASDKGGAGPVVQKKSVRGPEETIRCIRALFKMRP